MHHLDLIGMPRKNCGDGYPLDIPEMAGNCNLLEPYRQIKMFFFSDRLSGENGKCMFPADMELNEAERGFSSLFGEKG